MLRIPPPLSDDLKHCVPVPGYMPASERAAKYVISPIGHVFRDDGKLIVPKPNTLWVKFGGGTKTKSVAVLVWEAFFVPFDLTSGEAAWLRACVKRGDEGYLGTTAHEGQGRSFDDAANLVERGLLRKAWTNGKKRREYYATTAEGHDALLVHEGARPSYKWAAWPRLEAPEDKLTGHRRCSVDDVVLVPRSELSVYFNKTRDTNTPNVVPRTQVHMFRQPRGR